eukprot:95322-Ditylum_brightwellii.AAC.1
MFAIANITNITKFARQPAGTCIGRAWRNSIVVHAILYAEPHQLVDGKLAVMLEGLILVEMDTPKVGLGAMLGLDMIALVVEPLLCQRDYTW